MTRIDEIQNFISDTSWASAEIKLLAGDASSRKYVRLEDSSGGSAVVMDAPIEAGNDIKPFLNIANFLSSNGLNAPVIWKSDVSNGFILMEDFGDTLFDRVIKDDPTSEITLYQSAIESLDKLSKISAPVDAPQYGISEMAEASGLVSIWYAQGKDPAQVSNAMRSALSGLDWSKSCLVLRDFHAQNLVWCEGRIGIDRVGLLDFQDAGIGHPLYDAVSLIHDIRRDVSPSVANELKSSLAKKYSSIEEFDLAFATLSAQRNLRILGVFARLCWRDSKPDYIDYIPKVWNILQQDLSHPKLAQLNRIVKETLPIPTVEYQEELRRLCGKHQANA